MVTKPSLRATLVAMNKGQTERVPVGSFAWATVRNYCFCLGFELSRKYSSRLDKEGGYYEIIREL